MRSQKKPGSNEISRKNSTISAYMCTVSPCRLWVHFRNPGQVCVEANESRFLAKTRNPISCGARMDSIEPAAAGKCNIFRPSISRGTQVYRTGLGCDSGPALASVSKTLCPMLSTAPPPTVFTFSLLTCIVTSSTCHHLPSPGEAFISSALWSKGLSFLL